MPSPPDSPEDQSRDRLHGRAAPVAELVTSGRVIAPPTVGSVGAHPGKLEAMLDVNDPCSSVTDGGHGSSLGERMRQCSSDATLAGAACNMRNKPMICSVCRRPSGDRALRSCTTCDGLKSCGIRACRIFVKKADAGACYVPTKRPLSHWVPNRLPVPLVAEKRSRRAWLRGRCCSRPCGHNLKTIDPPRIGSNFRTHDCTTDRWLRRSSPRET